MITATDLPDIFSNTKIDLYLEYYQQDLIEYVKKVNEIQDSNLKPLIKKFYVNKLEEKWTRILGFNKSDILSDIQELLTPKVDFKQSLTLKEALASYVPGSSWIVPTLLRRSGLYILAAEPKVGKTILLNFLMFALSVSNDFLGMPAKPVNTLYIQLEESLDTIAERFMMTGFGNLADEDASLAVNFGTNIRIERKFDINTDIDWLIRTIQEYNAEVTIIDSLRMSQLESGADENTGGYGKAVYRLQRVFNYTNTCGIIIHHMSKLGSRNVDKTSLIDRLSGHTSISGGSDGIIGLLAEDTSEGRVITMKTLPRQGIHLKIKYKLETNQGLWQLKKLSEESPAKSEYTSKILRFLAQESNRDKSFTSDELAKGINCKVDDEGFKDALTYLDASQIIIGKYVSKRFVYTLPEDSLWIINPTKLKDRFSSTILDANNLMRCQSKQDIRDLIQDWTDERQVNAKRLLMSDELLRLMTLVKSYEYTVGDEVVFDGNIFTIDEIIYSSPSLNNNEYRLKNFEEVIKECLLSPSMGIVKKQATVDSHYVSLPNPLISSTSTTSEFVESTDEVIF